MNGNNFGRRSEYAPQLVTSLVTNCLLRVLGTLA